jgi:hypothetical protein
MAREIVRLASPNESLGTLYATEDVKMKAGKWAIHGAYCLAIHGPE